jgi:hypothetical protein
MVGEKMTRTIATIWIKRKAQGKKKVHLQQKLKEISLKLMEKS